jgi:hypothetical protein
MTIEGTGAMRSAGSFGPIAALFALVVLPKLAKGDPPSFPIGASNEDELDDRIDDGDIDEEDRAALRIGGQPGAADVHGQSWLSVVGFGRQLWSGKNDIGAGLVLALALDRIAQGPVHKISDVSPPAPEASAASPRLLFPTSLAHDCVIAAWRSAGLGIDDARIDSIISRSRESALLPEMRLRAMRLFTDAQHTTLLATTDATNYYDAIGANLVLEARLTWRLDRLVYAGDEPTLERVRLERQEVRSRLGVKTLEALFAWERASLDEEDAGPGAREQREAALRTAQAASTLDVLTGGWFSARGDAP